MRHKAALALCGLVCAAVGGLLAVPVALVAAIAIVSLGLQAEWRGESVSQGQGIFAWVFAVVAWAAVIGARALRDSLRADAAKQQAVARTTVVRS